MNILYLAHRIPYPPDKGDKLRSYHQLARLCCDHRVWCACFVDDARDLRHVATLERMCAGVAAIRLHPARATLRGVLALAGGGILSRVYYQDARMRRQLAAWSRAVQFDAAVMFSSSMASYAGEISAGRRILDLCDRDSQKWLDYAEFSRWPMRALYRREGRRLARFEEQCLREFDATLVITESETCGLRGGPGSAKLHVVGNGAPQATRVGKVKAYRGQEAVGPGNQKAKGGLIVGFVGAMDYRPNVDGVCWFVQRCWPAIRAKFPRAEFRIVGRSPNRAVRRLALRPGVVVVGEVAEVGAEIDAFDVSVAPLRIARGLQNKVLEAFAYGKPVVLTGRAAAGLQGPDGEHFVVADEAGKFAGAVCDLLSDADRRREMGEAAQSHVARAYRWEAELDRFAMIVTGTARGRSAGPDLVALTRCGPPERDLISAMDAVFRSGVTPRYPLGKPAFEH